PHAEGQVAELHRVLVAPPLHARIGIEVCLRVHRAALDVIPQPGVERIRAVFALRFDEGQAMPADEPVFLEAIDLLCAEGRAAGDAPELALRLSKERKDEAYRDNR